MGSTRLVVCNLSSATLGNNTTRYNEIGSSSMTQLTVEAEVQKTIRVNGTFSNLFARVIFNSSTLLPSTLVLRKNGVNGNMAISVPPGGLGVFEDLVNTDIVTAGENWNIRRQAPNTSGNINYRINSVTFSVINKNYHFFNISFGGAGQTFSSDIYGAIFGTAALNVTETGVGIEIRGKILTDGIAKHLYVYVISNVTTVATIISRKNSTNGNLAVSIPSGGIGVFEDITNTDVLVDGDEYNYFVDITSGSNFVCRQISIGFETTNRKQHYAIVGFTNVNFNTTVIESMAGFHGGGTVESDAKLRPRFAKNTFIRKFLVKIGSNTITTDPTTISFRKNVVDVFPVSVPAGALGIFSTSGIELINATDDVNYRAVAPNTSGLLQVQQWSSLMEELEIASTNSIFIPKKTHSPIISSKLHRGHINKKTHMSNISNKSEKILISKKSHILVN